MNALAYAVREAAPHAVADDVARIWHDNLSLAMDGRARFTWVYEQAPDPPAQVLLLTARETGTEPSVVGTAGIAQRRFQVGSTSYRAAHLVDLAVDAPHRSLGPALTLVREGRRAALAGDDLAYGFPNAKARGVFRRAGYRPLEPVTRFARVLRHRRYLERYLGRGLLAAAVGGALDLAVYAWHTPRSLRARSRYTLDFTEEPDARFDALWERSKGEYDIVAWRGAALLRWRFFGGHRGQRRIATLCARGEPQRLVAYAVLERQGATVHLRDLFGEKAALGPLLDLLLPVLRAEGAESASFMFLGPEDLQAELERRGFRERERERVLFFDSASPDLVAALSVAERWFVTDADDDS